MSCSHKVAWIQPLTWRAGCHEEGATWFGGAWPVAAWAFSATSSPSDPWGLHISLPSSCKDYKKNIILVTQHKMVVQGCTGQILISWKHKIGKNYDSAIMWRTTKMPVRCCKASKQGITKKRCYKMLEIESNKVPLEERSQTMIKSEKS